MTLREQQIEDSESWYGWEHYGPKDGWAVENIRVTSMPEYSQDEDGNWHIVDGGIGINVIGEMPERPQFIEREGGYALRLDVEAVEWWFRFTNAESREEHNLGWSAQELKGGLSFTVPRSPIWFLQDGQVWEAQAWARPRLRRARYDPGVPRTSELWSSEAAGIGESEPGDTVSESAVYCFQWNEAQYEMLSWPVDGEKPVSHVPWYQPPAETPQPDQDFARWVGESQEKIKASFDMFDDDYMGRQMGLSGDDVRAIKEGRMYVEDLMQGNIEQVLNAWLGSLE